MSTIRIPPRLNLWKITICDQCGEEFQQLKAGNRRRCSECKAVNTRKAGKR